VFSDDLPDAGSYHSRPAASSSSSRAGRSPSPEISLEALRRRDREKAVAQGKQYARAPTSFKDNLSMASLSATTRKRSRTPPPKPRDNKPALPTVEETGGRKPQLTEEQKQARAALMAKYGDAASQKELQAKRTNRKDGDDDIIRLGL
jgi:pre-mRNA-splicing factor 38B